MEPTLTTPETPEVPTFEQPEQQPAGGQQHEPKHPKPEEPQQKEGLKGAVSTIALLLLAPVIAIFLTMFVFQSYQVDGPSMQETLHNADRLIVWKVPRTWARITRHNYIPNRGDVIIFNHADGAALEGNANKQLIKRVVALPGERVVVRDGILTVYNEEHPEGFSPDKTLPYGSVITDTPGNVDITVPEGSVFVAGDNRHNSLDSRYFGAVPAHDIVGKLGLRVYPFSDFDVF